MIDTKLILVEGVTGSGKSSTAQFITLQLQKNNIQCRWFHEMEDVNPVGRPFLSNEDISRIDEILNKWENFCHKYKNTKEIIIIDGRFLSLVLTQMLNYTTSFESIINFYNQLFAFISRFNPCLIYLRPDNIKRRILKTYKGRRTLKKAITFLEKTWCNYCKENNLKGFKGMVKFWEKINKIMCVLYDSFRYKKIIINTAKDDWIGYYKKICRFLSLNYINPISSDDRIVGKYICNYNNQKKRFIIIRKKNNYFLKDFPFFKITWELEDKKLIFISKNVYYVLGLPFKLLFHEKNNNKNEIDYFQVKSIFRDIKYFEQDFRKI